MAVVRLVFRKGMLLVAIGLALGLGGAAALTHLLRQQLFGVEPTDSFTYVGVCLCFVLVGTLACLLPALRAVRVDPVEAFREE